jgi:hypothetical protein
LPIRLRIDSTRLGITPWPRSFPLRLDDRHRDRLIGSQQGAGALVAAHHDFQQIFGGGVGQLAPAEVVEAEQRHSGHRLHVLLARAIGDGVGQLIEQHVDLAVEPAVTLQDGGLADGLRQMRLARPAGTQKLARPHACR